MPGVNDWLRKASNDLKAAKKLSNDNETLDCSVFHTHQCAEKAFKGFMIGTGRGIPKTHDLKFLLECCLIVKPDFMLVAEESKNLNPYGTESRYPNDRFFVDMQQVNDAIKAAEKILVFIGALGGAKGAAK